MELSSSALEVNAVVVQRQVGRVDGVVVVRLEVRLFVRAVPERKQEDFHWDWLWYRRRRSRHHGLGSNLVAGH